MTSSNCYRNGRIYVLAEKCSTCIFWPGNLMHLNRGRLKEVVASNGKANSALTCHETLELDKNAICRGFFDAHADTSAPLRLAIRLSLIAEQDPPHV